MSDSTRSHRSGVWAEELGLGGSPLRGVSLSAEGRGLAGPGRRGGSRLEGFTLCSYPFGEGLDLERSGCR